MDLAEIRKLEIPSIIYDRTGREFQQIYVQNRRPVPIDAVPYH